MLILAMDCRALLPLMLIALLAFSSGETYNLQITDITTIPENPTKDDSFSVYAKVINIGGGYFPNAWLNASLAIDNEVRGILRFQSSIGPQEYVKYYLGSVSPLTPGTYEIRIELSGENVSAYMRQPVTVTGIGGSPDNPLPLPPPPIEPYNDPSKLVITRVATEPLELTEGDRFGIGIEMQNIGERDLESTVSITLSIGGLFIDSGTFVSTISPDGTKEYAFNNLIAPEPGNHKIELWVRYRDSDDAEQNMTWSGNIAVAAIPLPVVVVPSVPKLSVSGVDVKKLGNESNEIEVIFSVENAGNETYSGQLIGALLVDGEVRDQKNLETPINAGKSRVYKFSDTTSWLSPGQHSVSIEADFGSGITSMGSSFEIAEPAPAPAVEEPQKPQGSSDSAWMIGAAIIVVLVVVAYMEPKKLGALKESIKRGAQSNNDLEKLLEEKAILEDNMRMAKARYFKREMDEGTYKEIVKGANEKIIQLDSKIIEIRRREKKEKELKEQEEGENEIISGYRPPAEPEDFS